MKKVISVLLLFCLLTSLFFAGTSSVIDSVVTFVLFEGDFTKKDKVWLEGAVKDKLEGNLIEYASIKPFDLENEAIIKSVQSKFQDDHYNSEDIIEAGELTGAKNGLFITVRQVGDSNSYTLTVRITNLTRGETEKVIDSNPRNSKEALYLGDGNAVNEITIKLCDALDIYLSSADRSYLKNGDKDLSADEMEAKVAKDKKEWEDFLNNINNEIELNSRDTDVGANARNAKLLADKAMAEQKIKAATEKEERLAENRRREREAEELFNKSSYEEQQLIKKMKKESEAKVELARRQNLKRESTMGTIEVIESLKKAVIDIRASVDSEIDFARYNAEQEKKQNRYNAYHPKMGWEDWQTDEEGNLIDEVRDSIEKDLLIREIEIDNRLENTENSIKSSVRENETALLDEIEENYSLLKNRTASTMNDELFVSFRKYDGKDKLWNFTIYLESEGTILYQAPVQLSYELLTGKTPDISSEDYRNNVNKYNNLLVQGVPILIFELDYDVEPLDLNHPSEYQFYFKELRFYETDKCKFDSNGDIIGRAKTISLPYGQSVLVRKFNPVMDLRTKEDLAEAAYIERIEMEQTQMEIMNREKYYWAYQEDGYGSKWSLGTLLFGGNFSGAMKGPSMAIEACLGFSPYVFGNIGFGWMLHTSNIEDFPYMDPNDSNSVVGGLSLYADIGYNKRFHFGGFHPNVYASAGIGFKWAIDMSATTVNSSYDDTSSSDVSSEFDAWFIPRLNVGVDVPFGEIFSININLGFDYNAGCPSPIGTSLSAGATLGFAGIQL